MKQGCHGRLSASAATIHGQNPRSAIVGSVSIEKQTNKVTDRRYSPWAGQWFPKGKLHVHVEIPCFIGITLAAAWIGLMRQYRSASCLVTTSL